MILDNSYKIRPLRIELSEKFITNFDYIDRNPSCQFPCGFLVNKIIIQTHLSTTKIYILHSMVWLEFFGSQRFFSPNSLNHSTFSSTISKLTVRKRNFFLILEACLNSVFLNSTTNLTYIKLNQNLYFFFKSEVLNNLNFSYTTYSDFSYLKKSISIRLFNSK